MLNVHNFVEWENINIFMSVHEYQMIVNMLYLEHLETGL